MEVILSHEKGHRSKQGRFEEPGGEYVFQLSVDVFLNKSSVASWQTVNFNLEKTA